VPLFIFMSFSSIFLENYFEKAIDKVRNKGYNTLDIQNIEDF